MNKSTRFIGLLAGITLLTASVAGAAPSAKAEKQSYLIQLKPGANARGLGGGHEVVTEWGGINAIQVRMTAAQAEALAKHPMIEEVAVDETRHAMALYGDGAYTWGVQAVKATEAWAAGGTGAGIKVCVLDTGIDYNHPAFVRNGVSIIKGSKNFVADGHADATDGHGHGTHVAGTIAGQGNGPGSYFGVAPGADLYIGRVLGDDGSGATSGIINGVNWCVSQGTHIISMSLGGGTKSRTEENTYNTAYNGGKLIIAAAGNAGNTTTSYPAGYANVISIAAVDANLAKASFSQSNKDVELAGPGVSVLSSVPLGHGLNGSATEGSSSYKANGLEFAPTGTVSGQLVECGLADTTTSCTGKPASGTWIAVVNRGTNTFADKVTKAQAQGAAGVMIANNDTANADDPGSFTLGAAGNWIPAVSVSYNAGVAIRSGGLGTGSVAITAWDYAYFDGTSMATPHASAVAALAWSAKPALKNTTIRSILQTTTRDLGAAGRDNSFGYGLVQADAAVAKAKISN